MTATLAISDEALVGKSVIGAAEALGLTREQLANAIGVSVPTVARMKSGGAVPGNKPFELSLMVIRIYRALFAIVGGDNASMKHWMSTPNKHFSGECPNDLIQKVDGISQLVWYLDAMRGRI
ncbi:XRE family transcriptional regulator [Teredinibacter sp. KSP-S5-2]|uniref:XRE family transcriptional regulator n=1 Tax=Teredinibacter sp. KSP-S5-2 TaxID=3034506 RepID=UPI00293462EC|nr:XRE family transcriptional regulator [Teredinibacter sp. KSP-S5-2]WNO10030.1 XRE family transcriptional regulator [Teredinibacter sp. KSP-S5-2]